MSLNLGVYERGESTKTGTHQGTIPQHPDLQAFYRYMKAVLPPNARVFNFHMKAYNTVINRELARVRSPERGAHILRHAFAVWLLFYEEWERTRVRQLGRWARDEGMMGYDKKHLLLKNEQGLTKEESERGLWMWEKPRERFGLRDVKQALESLEGHQAKQSANPVQVYDISDAPPESRYPKLPEVICEPEEQENDQSYRL